MSDGGLPLQTAILLAASEIMVDHWPKLMAVPFVLAAGVWLALRGLRAIMEATDGRGPKTRLEPAIFAELNVTSARAAMQWTMRPDTARSQLASLAPVVLATAEDGDRVAQEIVTEGARQLGRLARALGESLEWPVGAAIPVVPAGGLLERRSYRDAVRAELAAADVRFALLEAPAPAVAGAVFLAAELAGAPFSAEARRRLATELATR
jgi:N-acetylglucosamine kinase-like BadF-type ATPase